MARVPTYVHTINKQRKKATGDPEEHWSKKLQEVYILDGSRYNQEGLLQEAALEGFNIRDKGTDVRRCRADKGSESQRKCAVSLSS